MFYLFFALAARSPSRQWTFRRAVAAHLCVLAGVAWALYGHRPGTAPLLLGHVLLVAGAVGGAALVGWRPSPPPLRPAPAVLLGNPLPPRPPPLPRAPPRPAPLRLGPPCAP